ncbi:MAG: fatty acid hydroxylase [Bacteroidetes bacterium]|nr:MAG: fatty acid hydroxylase [Bacteroidota bacterium]
MSTQKNDRIFKNKFLESLTRTHIAVPLTIFYGAAIGLVGFSLYYGIIAPMANLWLFLGGFVFFTLIEYLIHRYAFHINTDTPSRAKFQHTFHGVHHDSPRDKTRLAMPPVASVTLATILFLGYRFILGFYGLPFAAGFLAGYASYLVIHYSVHAFRPPNNFFKILWIHHAIHHYKEPEAAFGVSSPIWDHIFRTLPKTKSKVNVAETDLKTSWTDIPGKPL